MRCLPNAVRNVCLEYTEDHEAELEMNISLEGIVRSHFSSMRGSVSFNVPRLAGNEAKNAK